MYKILLRLIVGAALLELGVTWSQLDDCSGRACWTQLQRASLQVLQIDWKPISVFPKEARRFREAVKK